MRVYGFSVAVCSTRAMFSGAFVGAIVAGLRLVPSRSHTGWAALPMARPVRLNRPCPHHATSSELLITGGPTRRIADFSGTCGRVGTRKLCEKIKYHEKTV